MSKKPDGALTSKRREWQSGDKLYQSYSMKKEWQWKQLGELCKTGSGGTPLKSKREYYERGTIPWLMSGEVCQRDIRTTSCFITQKGLENSSARIFPKDTVLVAMYGATAGQVGILRFESATNQAVCGILPNEQFQPEFLYYFLLSKQQDLVAQATGNAQPNISQIKIKNTILPIVPLPEQQRIVAILDEAFSAIATAKANAEKNLQNARAIFESHLQFVFTQRGPGWVEKRLGDVFDIGSSKRILETEWTSAGIPFYGGKEIVKLAKYGTVISNAYISEEKYRDYASRYDMPRQGDILITARGTIGVGYVVKEDDKFYYKDGNIISMRGKNATNPHFILFAFRSNVMSDQLGELTGTTVRHLPIEKAKTLVLGMPGLVSQNVIVKQIRKMEEETNRLATIYQQKLTALEALKKSLLHQAFTGEL